MCEGFFATLECDLLARPADIRKSLREQLACTIRHFTPDDLNGHGSANFDQLAMEFALRIRILGTLLLDPLITELHDLKLAERVVEICRIQRSAPRLLERRLMWEMGFLFKQFSRLLHAHALRVEFNAGDPANITHERPFKLGNLPPQLALRIPAAVPLVQHQLLTIKCPPLGI